MLIPLSLAMPIHRQSSRSRAPMPEIELPQRQEQRDARNQQQRQHDLAEAGLAHAAVKPQAEPGPGKQDRQADHEQAQRPDVDGAADAEPEQRSWRKSRRRSAG